jgi:hypothetical protein
MTNLEGTRVAMPALQPGTASSAIWPDPIPKQGSTMISLHDIHTALQAGTLRTDNPVAAIAALDVLVSLHDLPLSALDLDAPKFARAFPQNRVPEIARPVFKGEVVRYRMFRNTILDCQMIADPGNVDDAPWNSLRRLVRLCLGAGENTIYSLVAFLPNGVMPGDLSRDLALSTDSTLGRPERARFRRGLSILDALHEHELARASGLLPAERIGWLPRVNDHAILEPLPPALRALRDGAPTHARGAVGFLWRLAVAAGVFQRCEDPTLEDLGRRYSDLVSLDPAQFELVLSDRSMRLYARHFVHALVAAGCDDPRASSSAAAWRELKALTRAAGFRTARLDEVAKAALCEDLEPGALTPSWFAEGLARHDRQRAQVFRAGAYLLDALRDDDRVPQRLLPVEPTGVKRLRRPKGSPKPTPAPRPSKVVAPTDAAWMTLFAAARAQGYDDERLHPLYTLKRLAIASELAPRELTVEWLVGVLNREVAPKRSAIYASTRLLDEFVDHPAVGLMVPDAKMADAVMAKRRDRQPLPKQVAAELGETLAVMGAGDSTRREADAALKALVEVSGTSSDLDELLRQDFVHLDWGPFAGRAKGYKLALDRLRVFRELPWTDGWRALQRVVIAAGVPMSQNPVPRLLPYAKGREPFQLDTPWAAETDRTLRSTLLNPPHGRADLALTFASNIRRLDALHGIGAVAASGLLPPQIEAYRARRDG